MDDIKVLNKKGCYQLMEYSHGYYSIDYNGEGAGFTILFSQDKDKVFQAFNEIDL
ncbi:hypothetical protein [Halobacillus litoralis]|uniref:hypothetical protein n=1 Tax=Halobacillus litoralis TaxID=45668 RepID=UPI001CD1958D|nr:hypothetical protein [Halobacillus litoralis]MCA1021605.1 hypothetical protein [Halobacillus litoralis]